MTETAKQTRAMDTTVERLCTICARGGSKGVPRKNIRLLLGIPLIAHSILQAKTSGLFSWVSVSSDCEEILEVAKSFGADYLVKRPNELASDVAGKLEVIQHCASATEKHAKTEFQTFVDLDVTAPLRTIGDIEEAVRLLETRRVSNVLTGSVSPHSPYFNVAEINDRGVVQLSKPLAQTLYRRQDAPVCYDLNGSIYVWSRKGLFETKTVFNTDTLLYEMPRERSFDIDSELDFEIVEFFAKKRQALC